MRPNDMLPRKNSRWTALICLIVAAGIIAAGCQRSNPSTLTPVAATASQTIPEPTTLATALSTAEPTALVTALPTAVPTGLATALSTPEPTGVATPVFASGRPYFLGTIYVQSNPNFELYGPPFTGVFVRLLKPETAIATLEAARAKGIQLFINMASKRQDYQQPNLAFSVPLYNQKLDGFRNIDFAPYVADGTVLGNILVDEPQDPTNWNGLPMPYQDLEAIAAHSKQLWPSLPVGVYGPTTWLQGGAPWTSLEFGVAQYTMKKGEFSTWMGQEVDAARKSKLGLILALNALTGVGKNERMTADEIKNWGQGILTEPYACAVLLIRYDPKLMQDPPVVPVLADLGQLARKRPAQSCVPAK